MMIMMMNKSILAVALVVVAILSLTSGTETGLSGKKIKKSFDELNKQLGSTKKPIDSMAKILKIINDRSLVDFFKQRSFKETLDLLLELEAKRLKKGGCDKRTKLLEKFDSAWDEDETRRVEINYPVTKVDEMIAYQAVEVARQCPFEGQWPKLKHAYKQLAYDYINDYLLVQLEEDEDIETNMSKIHQLLHELQVKDGAVAQALEQLLRLRSTLGGEEVCNAESDDILLLNDLATKGLARPSTLEVSAPEQETRLRRVDQIVLHFTQKHLKICRVTRKKFDEALRKLNVNTYRSVLGLVNHYYYLGQERTGEIVKALQAKEVNEDFTTPLLVEYAKSLAKDEQLSEVKTMEINDLRNYVKHLIELVPGTWASPEEEWEERRKIPEGYLPKSGTGGLNEYFNRFLIIPCHVYVKSVCRLVGANFPQNHRAGDEKLVEDLPYQVARSACRACSFVSFNRQQIYYGMM